MVNNIYIYSFSTHMKLLSLGVYLCWWNIYLLSTKPQVWCPTLNKPEIVAHIYNPCTQEVEARGSEAHCYFWLCSKSKASLGYIRSTLTIILKTHLLVQYSLMNSIFLFFVLVYFISLHVKTDHSPQTSQATNNKKYHWKTAKLEVFPHLFCFL